MTRLTLPRLSITGHTDHIDIALHISTLRLAYELWCEEGLYGVYAALRIKHMQRKAPIALRACLYRASCLDDVLA